MQRDLAILQKKIGLRIRDRRISLEISQEDLAFKADISPTYLSQIEGGKRNPSVETLFSICVALQIELAELVSYLNSKSSIELWSKVDREIGETIEYMGQEEELMPILQRWKALIAHRDVEMMKNIQKYSEEHEFNKGVFLLGAAHRGAIIEKAGNPSLGNSVTLNWNFENYEGLI
jgi:transcriptional regulator with XRE-family HTH domain